MFQFFGVIEYLEYGAIWPNEGLSRLVSLNKVNVHRKSYSFVAHINIAKSVKLSCHKIAK